MNAENLRTHINVLLEELSKLNGNGGLHLDSNSQDVQMLRKKISELHDRLTVLEHLLQYPAPPPPSVNTEQRTEPKNNPVIAQPTKKKDLKSSVGLNDRFRFVNELFGGSSDEFNAALNQLETMETHEEADDYLDRLAEVYHWDKSGHAHEDFVQLVRRFLGK